MGVQRKIENATTVTLALALGLALAACGGGGGGGTSEPAAPGSATGRVAVLLTDAPTPEFDQVWVTISSVHLLGDRGAVPVSDQEQTVDLLHLRADALLLSLADGVPAGTYHKIRLEVKEAGAVLPDNTRVPLELTGGGKLDLTPREPFTVAPGATVVVTLDMDAQKSIHIHETGNGKWMFRPVVFVEVASRFPADVFVRVKGTVERIDPTASAFLLRPDHTLTVAPAADSPPLLKPLLAVHTDDETGFFDDQGRQVDFPALKVGDPVTVAGWLSIDPADLGETGVGARLDAAVVEIGHFLRLGGTVLTAPDGSPASFLFQMDAGQGFAGGVEIPVELFPKTRIVSRGGIALDLDAIQPGKRLVIDGVLYLPTAGEPAADRVLRAALILVDPFVPLDRVSGTLASVDPVEREARLADPATLRLIFPADEARVFLVTAGSGGQTFEEVAFEELKNHLGSTVTLFGRYEQPDRLVVRDALVAK